MPKTVVRPIITNTHNAVDIFEETLVSAEFTERILRIEAQCFDWLHFGIDDQEIRFFAVAVFFEQTERIAAEQMGRTNLIQATFLGDDAVTSPDSFVPAQCIDIDQI